MSSLVFILWANGDQSAMNITSGNAKKKPTHPKSNEKAASPKMRVPARLLQINRRWGWCFILDAKPPSKRSGKKSAAQGQQQYSRHIIGILQGVTYIVSQWKPDENHRIAHPMGSTGLMKWQRDAMSSSVSVLANLGGCQKWEEGASYCCDLCSQLCRSYIIS